MEKIRLSLNIIFFPSTLWGAYQFYQGVSKVIGDVEIHPPFYLLLFMIGTSALIGINWVWITKCLQKLYEVNENAKPKNQLIGLANDVVDLAFRSQPGYRTNSGWQDNPVYMALADNTFKRLSNICDLQKPTRIEQYPDFFRGILPFVRRGDVDAVKRAAHVVCQSLSNKGGTIDVGGGVIVEIEEGKFQGTEKS